MSLNLNLAVIAGRLTREPELRTTSSGVAVTTFTIAVNRAYGGDNKVADFIECVAWRERADFITKYFRKGMAICVRGEIQTRTYEDKDNVKRKVTEILVDKVDFVESKNVQQTAASDVAPTTTNTTSIAPTVTQESILDQPDDDDLPF